MKKLLLLLIVIVISSSCTKDLPDGIWIYVDISEVSVSENYYRTNNSNFIDEYYNKTISRAKFKNALITEDPNHADYIIKLNSITAFTDLRCEYRNGRNYDLRSISVISKATLYGISETWLMKKSGTLTETGELIFDPEYNWLMENSGTLTETDELIFDPEYNEYNINESKKNYYDLISDLAHKNTNCFINKINAYEELY